MSMSSVPNFLNRNSLHMSSCVHWYVHVPDDTEQRRSSVFLLHGRKISFCIYKSLTTTSLVLNLVEEGCEERLEPFSVSVFAYLLNRNENKFELCCSKVPEKPAVNTWLYEDFSSMKFKLMRFNFLFNDDSGLPFNEPEVVTKHGLVEDDSTLLLNNLENLSVDFGKMLEASAHADVQIECNGGVVNAHKAVLASRSKVFDRMFQTDMKESGTGIIKMGGAEIAMVKVFLQYIYSGKIGNQSVDVVYCLYKLADKYDVPTLKNLCFDLMAQHVCKRSRE